MIYVGEEEVESIFIGSEQVDRAYVGEELIWEFISIPVTPHARVAAWVNTHLSDVIGYWPMSDAAPSTTMVDHGSNGLNGTYPSTVTSRAIDGEVCANFQLTSLEIPYNSIMNNEVAGFCVVILDSTFWAMLPARDGYSGRSYQWRINGTNIEFVKIGGGIVTASHNVSLTTATRYTMGWWIDGSICHLYVNGTQVGTTAMALPGDTASQMEFGFSTGGGSYLDGALGSMILLSVANSSTIPLLHNAWIGA